MTYNVHFTEVYILFEMNIYLKFSHSLEIRKFSTGPFADFRQVWIANIQVLYYLDRYSIIRSDMRIQNCSDLIVMILQFYFYKQNA